MPAAPLRALLALVPVSGVLRGSASNAVTDIRGLPFYHTSDELQGELRRLAGSCLGFAVSTQAVGDAELDLVSLRKPGSSPKSKMYLLFGEHARELISPESGLHFLRSLCGETEASAHLDGVLDDTEFRVVLNANPLSRRKVEAGDFCLRLNERGVDLNRNWGFHWKAKTYGQSVDTNPGPRAFSEPQTQLLRDDVTAATPTAFVSVHSGTRAMFMPYAYETGHPAERDARAMREILEAVDEAYCQCPFGPAGTENGFGAFGTSLDYAYGKAGARFAFLFEIYLGPGRYRPGYLRSRWRQDRASGLVQVAEDDEAEVGNTPQRLQHCLQLFNPLTAVQYNKTVDAWARAYGDLARRVAAKV